MDIDDLLLIVKRNFTFFRKMITLISFCSLSFGLKAYMMELNFYLNLIPRYPYFLETLFLLSLISLSLMFLLHRLAFCFPEVIMKLNLFGYYSDLYSYLLLIVSLHLISQKEYLCLE